MGEIQIAQLSDLHFSAGADPASTKHCHSIELLVAVEKCFKSLKPDYLIVSGDITNNGDKESLLKAQDWLIREFGIGGKQATGLKFPIEKMGVIPGNHDAWNSGSYGKNQVRWQRSIQNYNSVFDDHKIPLEGCYYDWIETDDLFIFIAFVDSSYLGDIESQGGNTDPISKIARGKISQDQIERLLNLQDAGTQGNLQHPREDSKSIPKDHFAKSLKILVMHHYLFPPSGYSSDYFMDLDHRDIVIRNIVMADFDIVLCGHKHIPDIETKSAGDLFDPRAKKRYLLNTLRRHLGMHSMPLQFLDNNGRSISKVLGFVINLFSRSRSNSDPEQLVDILLSAIENPSLFKSELDAMLKEPSNGGESVANKQELGDLQAYVQRNFTKDKKKELREKIKPHLSMVLKRLSRRSLVHVMNGSTTKASHSVFPARSFNLYKIGRNSNLIRCEMKRYSWNSSTKEFEQSLTHIHEFPDDRGV